jgi:Uma2 family endonuclease
MSSLAAAPPAETVADLVERVGSVPLHRIRLRPYPATEQDVLAVHDRENRLCELVDGVLVEKAMGFYESCVAVALCYLLKRYLQENDRGVVAGADGMMRLAAGLVRIPDVSFVPWEEFPNRQLPREPIPQVRPALAVEILSGSNTVTEMRRKIRDYFAAGAQLVWLIDPETGTAQVYTAPGELTVVAADGTLDGGVVLPGFQVRLEDLFAQAGGRRG